MMYCRSCPMHLSIQRLTAIYLQIDALFTGGLVLVCMRSLSKSRYPAEGYMGKTPPDKH